MTIHSSSSRSLSVVSQGNCTLLFRCISGFSAAVQSTRTTGSMQENRSICTNVITTFTPQIKGIPEDT